VRPSEAIGAFQRRFIPSAERIATKAEGASTVPTGSAGVVGSSVIVAVLDGVDGAAASSPVFPDFDHTRIARRTIPTITIATTRLDAPCFGLSSKDTDFAELRGAGTVETSTRPRAPPTGTAGTTKRSTDVARREDFFVALRAEDFLALFFTADLRAVLFFATFLTLLFAVDLRATDFLALFFAADFLAVFLTAT
jgi:hypothetical protein